MKDFDEDEKKKKEKTKHHKKHNSGKQHKSLKTVSVANKNLNWFF